MSPNVVPAPFATPPCRGGWPNGWRKDESPLMPSLLRAWRPAAPAGGALALSSSLDSPRAAFVAAALLIGLRLLANLLDGMVAVQTRAASPVGELYNEVPDRVSDAVIFIGAGYAVGSRPELGYLAACLSLFVAYVRAEGRAAGAHQEYCGPMAKTPRMAVLVLASLYCALLRCHGNPA